MKKETNLGIGIALGVVLGLLFHSVVTFIILGALAGLMIPVKSKDNTNNGTGN